MPSSVNSNTFLWISSKWNEVNHLNYCSLNFLIGSMHRMMPTPWCSFKGYIWQQKCMCLVWCLAQNRASLLLIKVYLFQWQKDTDGEILSWLICFNETTVWFTITGLWMILESGHKWTMSFLPLSIWGSLYYCNHYQQKTLDTDYPQCYIKINSLACFLLRFYNQR